MIRYFIKCIAVVANAIVDILDYYEYYIKNSD